MKYFGRSRVNSCNNHTHPIHNKQSKTKRCIDKSCAGIILSGGKDKALFLKEEQK